MPESVKSADSGRVLDVVVSLARELHPGWQGLERTTQDSSLDEEFGLDSLARVELAMRLEREFQVSLPEGALAEATTPRELARVVQSARPARARRPAPARPREPEGADRAPERPDRAETLTEVLHWHASRHPEQVCVRLLGDDVEPAPLSYGELLKQAREVAAGLQEHGLAPRQTVALMLPTGFDYLAGFYGILLAGGVPVPIYPPARASQLEDHLRRQAGVLNNALARLLITVPEAKAAASLLRARVPTLEAVVTRTELASSEAEALEPRLRGRDTAFLQYTSGSTGEPKGVVLSHDNLLANIRIMGEAVQVRGEDLFVSWLPLYHDMGLIGAWLGTLYYGIPVVLMSPLAFLTHPGRWLWALHEHGASLTAAPNFAYQICLEKISDGELDGLDLSRLRIAFNGAEPVSPDTLRGFCRRFRAYGFESSTMKPVYGLAEAAVGLAFPPLDRAPQTDRVERYAFTRDGRAQPAGTDSDSALEFVASGQPLPGYEIRVVDRAGRELPERREGRIEFRGPSATSGYFRNPEATRELFRDGWLDTGDLGYMAGGDIHVTTRAKDLIIRAGRNIHPYEVEEAVGEVTGVRKGCVAVFGVADRQGLERVVVVAETRERDGRARKALRAAVQSAATGPLGMAPDEVVLAPPGSVLKTSSGKIRRGAVRSLYQRGRIGKATRAVWLQVARIMLESMVPAWRSLRRRLAAFAYASWARLVFWALAPWVWLGVALLPGQSARWTLMRGGARALFRLCGVAPRTTGLEHLPARGPCVITANHSSYLDGVVLVATLPHRFRFVAKAELNRQFFAGVFLRRIGTQFVERFDHRQGAKDARKAVSVLQRGDSLLSFPEGTLVRAAGLLPFHMGPFLAAVEAETPVVPVVIRGTRSILRSGSWFPRHGPVSVRVLEPREPQGDDWESALDLRDAVRRVMLEYAGEPDLQRYDQRP